MKQTKTKVIIASVICSVMAVVTISTGAVISNQKKAENIRLTQEAVAEESYFVNDMVLDTIASDVKYMAHKDGIEVETERLVSGISNMALAGAQTEAEEIRKAEEAKRLEEEMRKAEENKAVEIAKAKASGVNNATVEQMTFAQTGDAILTYNVYQKSNLTVDQFNQMLKGTALAGCGQSYYNMENTYNVNGVFAVALACHESGNGYQTANTHNYYGMRAASGGWKSFQSADANIMYFGQYITGKMYYGKSMEDIGKIYCPGTWGSWAAGVKRHMNEKWNKISF